MTDIKIAVKGNRAALLRPVNLVANTVGQKCLFYFDNQWKSYPKKIITYKVGTTVLGSYEIENNLTIIPQKILMMSGLPLEIGLTGNDTENGISTPTPWCRIGVIKEGPAASANDNIIPDINDEIIYEGGGVSSYDETIYEGGGV